MPESQQSRARICKRLRRPGIDSEDSIPPAYVAWRVGTTNRVVVPARQAGNRFFGLLKRFTNTGSVGSLFLSPFSIVKTLVFPRHFTNLKEDNVFFVLGLLQMYSIHAEVEGVLPTEDYIPGATNLPRPFKVILKPRC